MNKATIKNFAVEARRKLIASVKDKAGRIGITKENITEAISKGEGYAVFPTHIGIQTTLTGKELKQRENLVNRIKEKGYESVMEEVAYTWFNRIIAVRFMEVNDYLPSRIRVLSSETKGKFEPDIVTLAPKIELDLTQQEIEEIISLKEKNELDKLLRLLFIKQCNELGEILPELFENTSKENKDYTEILLDISYTNEDGVIRNLLKVDEEDFLDAVEIIGWMYQYYNTEPKAVVDAYVGKKKVPKEDVPAKTQLFTPDWIVRYMVENSLGRLWFEGHPSETLKVGWKYYLDETEQEHDVIAQLEKIRAEYKNTDPEEIKVIDPCMGSGHILVYAFEVLMQIYESCGYSQRDAASIIIEKNLFGLDIDDRAYQLAYFALMMKGRKYDRRFLNKGIKPNLCSIQESNSLNSFDTGAGQLQLKDVNKQTANYLISSFKDAKEYGSILNIEEKDYDGLLTNIEHLKNTVAEDIFMSMWVSNISDIMPALIKQAQILAQKYDIVITNPPYFSSSDMTPKLSDYVRKYFPNSKTDMFAVFFEKSLQMSKFCGYTAMITMHSWMFLSSYEKLRDSLIKRDIINMIHLGARAFDEISGEVVQATTFVIRKHYIKNYKSTFIRLVNYKNENAKKEAYLESIFTKNNKYITKTNNFSKITGMPIAYWVSDNVLNTFEMGKPLIEVADCCTGMQTGNNDIYVRYWFEVSFEKTSINAINGEWKKYNCGGQSRKWYGNHNNVVLWGNNGERIKSEKSSVIRNESYYFREGISWKRIGSSDFFLRYLPNGFIFDQSGDSMFLKNEKYLKYILGYVNTKVALKSFEFIAPTLNLTAGNMNKLPIIINERKKPLIDDLVEQNISISKTDWDSFETSWDFIKHPLLGSCKISHIFNYWNTFTHDQFSQLKSNEEELNRIFIEIYGLQDEQIPEVEEKDITIYKADLARDIRSFISYAVGCMFGRYSLDVDGLAHAGGEWDDSKYTTFIPDKDNIIPITDEEYFNDDIVSRFLSFIKVVYGEETLEENLDFIANALGNKGTTSREVIRNYFLKDFYKVHVKTYQKRPIYWLFDSGKENGFKALIYLHRYNEDTVGRVRADYLHKTQTAIENAIVHCDVVLESNANASDKAKAVKKKEKLVKQLAETRLYDQAIAHIAHQRISLDLDDGVVVNYAKFQGITVASEGKKSVKVDLLAKI